MYVRSFLLALGLSLALTPLVRFVARRVGMVSPPRADRWHRKPTALLGGIGIYVAFLASYALFRDRSVHGGGLLVVCASSMFILGLVDDIFHLKPYAKLVVQIAAAAAFTTWGLNLTWTTSIVLNKAITIFWLVGLTNALNLLDNIDGLSGGIAVIAAAFATYFLIRSNQFAAAAISAAFAGAVLGFLVYNFNPASIFMGDSGSLFLGFFLGGMAILQPVNRSRGVVAVVAIPILILAIPILDTTFVALLRKLHGRPVSQGGRDHTSHRLVALGMSERGATLTLYALAIASGFTGVAAFHFPASVSLGLLPLFVLGLVFMAVYLARARLYERVADPAAASGRALLPTLADFAYKRRIFEVLLDLVLIIMSYYCAYLIRFDGQLVEPHWKRFVVSLPIIIVVQMGVFLAAGLYRGLWRYTSIDDLRRFLTATMVAVVLSLAVLWLAMDRLAGFSRAAFVIDWLLLFLGVAASRVSFRIMRNWLVARLGRTDARRVLIYGAGDGGELLLRELRNNESLKLIPVGFVDDDPAKHGKVIHGVRVVGGLETLSKLVDELAVEEILLASRQLDRDRLAGVTALCRQRAIPLRRARFSLD